MKLLVQIGILIALWFLVPRALLALDNYNGQFEADTAPSCTVSA